MSFKDSKGVEEFSSEFFSALSSCVTLGCEDEEMKDGAAYRH